MPASDFLADLAEVGRGLKYDLINSALGLSDEDPGMSANDAGDAAKVLIGQGDFAALLGLSVGAYSKALEFVHDRQDRIEAGIEGAEDRGRALAHESIRGIAPDGDLSDASLRGFSDAATDGVLHAEDAVSSEYRESFYEAFGALQKTREPSAFSELKNQRLAMETGFDAEVSERCAAEWGYSSAAEARDVGVLEPLVPTVQTTTTEALEASETAPRSTSPDPSAPESEPQTTASTVDPELEHNGPPARVAAGDESATTPASDAEAHLHSATGIAPSGAGTDLEADSEPAPAAQEPTAGADEPYVTGDGDLAAQDHGHDAWVEAEAAEDAAIMASAETVDQPTGFDDPETYASDGDMAALTEAYDWEAEQFDEGATLFDEPALDATVFTPEQPVTVPDAEALEPDEPEV